MTLPTVESLRDRSRDELIALVLQLAARLERLEAEVEQLKRPTTTSRNSSQPPSRPQRTRSLTALEDRRDLPFRAAAAAPEL